MGNDVIAKDDRATTTSKAATERVISIESRLWAAFLIVRECFVNGLLDFIAGLVDTGALVLELLFDKVESQMLREGLENALQELREQPGKVKEQIKASAIDFFEHYNGDKNSDYEIAYHAGEDIITVVDAVVTVITVVGALKKLATKFKKLEEWIVKLIRKSLRLSYGKVAEEIAALRKFWTKSAALTKWYNLVRHEVLALERVKELVRLREGIKGLENANVARMRVRAKLKSGEVFEKEYLAHAQRGKKIPNSVGAPEVKPPDMEAFYDTEKRMYRWYDSENKMLIEMDKDLYGLGVTEMSIEMESTYAPCSICKREILIRQQKYGAKVNVKSPKLKNGKGKLEHVVDNPSLKIYLEQSKKK